MDLSVVIVNWNTGVYLRGCLDSLSSRFKVQGSKPEEANLEPETLNLKLEFIVVDNASTDGSAAMVASDFPEVRLIASEENLGWARGNNVGMAAAKGRYFLLLNPDTVVKAGALETLVGFMDAHPEAGACAPKLLNPDGTLQASVRRFPEPLALFWELTGLSKLFPHSPTFAAYRMGDFDYHRVAEVEQPMGSALLLRREAVEAVGGMDEAFPIFFNDADWCYRALQAGWKIYFVPQAEIIHYGGGSTRQVKPRMVTESHRSLERFYRKHYKGHISGLLFHSIVAMSHSVERLRIARAGSGAG